MEFRPEGRPEPDDDRERRTLLVLELADFAIEHASDCDRVFEELESIGEDYPGYLPVFRVAY